MDDDERAGATVSSGQEPPRPAAPGFAVQRWLGSGASASVWLVRELATGAEYALKVLSAPPTLANHNDDAGAPPPTRRAARQGAAAEAGRPAPWPVAGRQQGKEGAAAAA